MKTLTFREREIIRLRYGLADGYSYTLEEVGRIFKVTRERVRQIEAKAVAKLQNPVRSKYLEPFVPGGTARGRVSRSGEPSRVLQFQTRRQGEGETRRFCFAPETPCLRSAELTAEALSPCLLVLFLSAARLAAPTFSRRSRTGGFFVPQNQYCWPLFHAIIELLIFIVSQRCCHLRHTSTREVAMSVTAAALRELHRIHQQLAELRDRLERGPKQVRAREANVAQLEAKVAEARERAKQMQMAVDRKQLDLKSGEQKVVDLRVKLNACSSNREYQALLEQIAAAEMAGSVLSDEILEGLEKIDQLVGQVKEAEKNLAAGKTRDGKVAPSRRSSRPREFGTTLRGWKASSSKRKKHCLPISRPIINASYEARAPIAWPLPKKASAPAAASRSRSTCRTNSSSPSSFFAKHAAACSICRASKWMYLQPTMI